VCVRGGRGAREEAGREGGKAGGGGTGREEVASCSPLLLPLGVYYGEVMLLCVQCSEGKEWRKKMMKVLQEGRWPLAALCCPRPPPPWVCSNEEVALTFFGKVAWKPVSGGLGCECSSASACCFGGRH